MMVAPVVFLDPNMMAGILLYAFAAAMVGGFTARAARWSAASWSACSRTWSAPTCRFIGTELKLTVALVLIIIVLLVRPTGLFGRTTVRRV